MGRIIYWIDDYTDEVVPCDCTLQGWADWLALSGDEAENDWAGRGEIESGAEFAASTMEELEDVQATRGVNGWSVVGVVDPTANFFAPRYGPGSGWDEEHSYDEWPTFLDLLIKNGFSEIGDRVLVAVCRTGPNVRIRFDRTLAGPTCTVLSEVH